MILIEECILIARVSGMLLSAFMPERILEPLGTDLLAHPCAFESGAGDQLVSTASPFFENFRDSRGWGLGLSIVTRRGNVAGVPGRFGWNGAFSTSLYVDPRGMRTEGRTRPSTGSRSYFVRALRLAHGRQLLSSIPTVRVIISHNRIGFTSNL
jgi:hypothetical protein